MYYKGVQDVLTDQYKRGMLTVDFQAMIELKECSLCDGARLRQESLHVYLAMDSLDPNALPFESEIEEKYNIYDLQSVKITELITILERFQQVTNAPEQLVERIITPAIERAQTISDL